MSDQLTFDDHGTQLRDLGMERAISATEPSWLDRFYETAEILLKQNGSVTSEEVTDVIGMPPSRNAVGAAMAKFARSNGLTVRYEKSKKASSHAALIGRWF